MRLKAVLLQGEQSKCVFAAMPGIGVESLCVAAAEWSEGLALSSAGHCLSLQSTMWECLGHRDVLGSLRSVCPGV